MKIILTKDVRGIGRKGDVKDVPQGYAANYLMPHKMAVEATPRAVADLEARRKREAGEQAVADGLVRETLASIDGKSVPIAVKANEKGHLFARLHAPEVAAAINAATGATVDPLWLVDVERIREAGEHEVRLEAAAASAKVTLAVSALAA